MANDRMFRGRPFGSDLIDFLENLAPDKRWIISCVGDLVDKGKLKAATTGDSSFLEDVVSVLAPFFTGMARSYPDITRKYSSYIVKNLIAFLEDHRKKNPDGDREALVKDMCSYSNKVIKHLKKNERVTEGETDDPYKRLSNQLEGELHEVRRRIAEELAPVLNARIQAMPHRNYEEKKELARWVNEELRRFDLAIKGPTGQPSVLVAARGNPPDVEIGRLFLEYKSSDRNRARTQLPPQLPPFELMEAAPRREALREWHERASRGGSASRA
jgi:hypothetical protein